MIPFASYLKSGCNFSLMIRPTYRTIVLNQTCTQGCSDNKRVVGTHPKNKPFLKSFELILKQNIKRCGKSVPMRSCPTTLLEESSKYRNGQHQFLTESKSLIYFIPLYFVKNSGTINWRSDCCTIICNRERSRRPQKTPSGCIWPAGPGTPETVDITGTIGGKVHFHNCIIAHFMVHKDRLEANILQLFAYPKKLEWFSVTFLSFEANVVAEQKQV